MRSRPKIAKAHVLAHASAPVLQCDHGNLLELGDNTMLSRMEEFARVGCGAIRACAILFNKTFSFLAFRVP